MLTHCLCNYLHDWNDKCQRFATACGRRHTNITWPIMSWLAVGCQKPWDHLSLDWTTEQIKYIEIWQSNVALSINGFLDCAHHPIFNEEYNILQTWSVPTLKWKGAEVPTWLDLKETTIISQWTERVTALLALVLVLCGDPQFWYSATYYWLFSLFNT